MSLHNNICHYNYAELYEYLKYELLKWVYLVAVHTNCTNENYPLYGSTNTVLFCTPTVHLGPGFLAVIQRWPLFGGGR